MIDTIKIKVRVAVALLFVICGTVPLKGQDGFEDDTWLFTGDTVETEVRASVSIPLVECLAIGLENNFDILMQRNNQQIADNNATLGNAGYLPTVDLSGGYSGTMNNTAQKPRDGGGMIKSNGVHNGTLNAGVNVGWTVFSGFSVRTTYRRLQELQSIGELNTRLTIEDFIAQFTAAYYNYIRQNNRLENLQYAVSLSLERVRIVEANYTLGTMSRLDLQQAKVDLNSDRSLLMKQYATMHAMRTLLNQMLANEDIAHPIVAADSTIEYNPALSLNEISRNMLGNNTYLQLMNKDQQVSLLDLKLAESTRYPDMRFNGGYGYTGNWYGAGNNIRQRNLGFNYGVTVGMIIFDGKNQRRRERNASIDVKNRDLARAEAELSMNKSLSDTWMSYENNMRLTRLERDNLTTARDNYEIAMERYRLGQLSGIELREAQTSLLEAGERLVQALLDTKLNEITLLNLSGQVVSYME